MNPLVVHHSLYTLSQILKTHFGMVAPDVEIDDGKGTILVSSEEGETEGERERKLLLE